MGLLLLPFILALFFLSIKSMITVYKKISRKEFSFISIFFSCILSGLLYVCLLGYWSIKYKIGAFEPVFFIPGIGIGFPYVLCQILRSYTFRSKSFVEDILLGTVIVSTVLLIVLNENILQVERIIEVKLIY